MKNSFYSENELTLIGFKFGNNVKVSRYARFYSPEIIEIGDNVRIDDFCIISGRVKIGSYVHIAAYASIFAGNIGVDIGSFSGISSYSSLYAITDDFSGDALIGPTIPDEFRNVIKGKITLEKHCHIGSHSLVFPNTFFKEGSVLGAMSMIGNRKLDEWFFYFGIPAKKLYRRNKDKSLEMEYLFLGKKN